MRFAALIIAAALLAGLAVLHQSPLRARAASSGPVIYAINPNSGPPQGGTFVAIFGSGFTGATSVKFGSLSSTTTGCFGFFVNSDTRITVSSPPQAVGTVDVVVTGPGGSSAITPADKFTYANQTIPVIYGISPSSGPTSGGTRVTIYGSGLSNASRVLFGTTPGGNFGGPDQVLTAISPSGTVGTVDITVVTPGGTSAPTVADRFTYAAPGAPTVQAVSPNHATAAGNVQTVIAGTGFTQATAVHFGSTVLAANNFAINSDTAISTLAPPGTAATTVDVTVTNVAGTSATGSADRFSYVAPSAPIVSGVATNRGPTIGGTSIILFGSGFSGATTVSFGSNAGAGLNVFDDSHLVVTSPAGALGTVDITVTTPAGTSPPTVADQFNYVALTAPVVYGISPHIGSAAGHTLVSVYGDGFVTGSTVKFGANAGTQVQASGQFLSVVSPAGSAGTVDITVTNPAGTSAPGIPDQFIYLPIGVPIVHAVSPNRGFSTGGTRVEVFGEGLTGATAVKFGTTAGTSVIAFTDTVLDVTSPAGTSGTTVDVTVTNSFGTSTTSVADQFSFFTPVLPTVTAVSPSSGPQSGGGTVWITGAALSGASSVVFGTNVGFNYQPYSDTLIRVNSAPSSNAAGTVDVKVTTPGGTSTTTVADQYTYTAAATPVVNSVGPSSGPSGGGTTVYIGGTNVGGPTSVTFGGVAAPFFSFSAGLLTAVSPAGTAGATVDVLVTTAGGTSAPGPNAKFMYTTPVTPPAPVVTGVSPSSGPPGGGTTVYIRGSNFAGATNVALGATPVFPSLVTNDLISFVSPTGTPSTTVHITVTTPSGTSATSTNDQYTFSAATTPVVTGISPATGPAAGGTTVYIRGSGFLGSSAVSFGSTGAFPNVISDNLMSAVSPAQGGSPSVVDITVTNFGLTSATSSADQFTYGGPAPTGPRVDGIAPNHGPGAVTTQVVIYGLGFTGATAVKFGSTAAQGFFPNGDTQLVAFYAAPAPAGTVDVTVTVGSTSSSTSNADKFTFTAPVQPVVYGVDPSQGSASGDTQVTVYGSGFGGTTSVRFGGVNTNVPPFAQSDTQISVTSPPGPAATTVHITVTNSAGTSATSGADSFNYLTPGAPVVNGIDPASGTSLGGTAVSIHGSNLAGATSVNFGSTPATSFYAPTDSNLFAISPAGTASTIVDVTVTTPGGTSATSTADKFTWFTPPTPRLDAISPNRGGLNGGNTVLIFGAGLAGATAVHFGANLAAQLGVATDDTIFVTSPAGALGTVDVTVTTPGGTSSAGASDHFAYFAAPAPSISVVNPNSGKAQTLVYLTGTGLSDVNTVSFGPSGCTFAYGPVRTDNVVAVYAPAGPTGAVDVTVTSPEGTSAITVNDKFTYTAAGVPTITAVAPATGPSSGGTLVSITGTGLANATNVTFGTTSVPPALFGPGFFSVDDNLVQVFSPAGSSGTAVDIHVTTPAGTSATTSADRFTWTSTPAPTVSAVSPNSGPSGGGSDVFITGSGFVAANLSGSTASQVQFGTTSLTSCAVPLRGGPFTAASIHVGSEAGPVLTQVPLRGTTAGSTRTSVGSSTAAPTVTFSRPALRNPARWPVTPNQRQSRLAEQLAQASGPQQCGFRTVADNLIEAHSPPQGTNPATVDVTVTAPGGTSATGSADKYTYAVTALPSVSAVSPSTGPSGGGTVVYVSGSNFSDPTAVHFGATPATAFSQFSIAQAIYGPLFCNYYFCEVNDTVIQATSPPGTNPSTVDVTVTTPGGTSATGGADQYTYGATATPTVTAVAPGSGPVGTAVFMTGTGFTNATALNFGTTPSQFAVLSDTLIQAPSPVHATGLVDVTAVTAGGTSATSAADQYTFTTSPTPVVAAIGPSGGPAGTAVWITGTGFIGVSAVAFGTTSATKFAAFSSHLIEVFSPTGAGSVDVTVSNPAGTSATSSADVYSYGPTPAPTVASVVPNSGPAAGGTSVTITGTNFISVTSVQFGSAAATGVIVNSGSSITATSPAGSGTVDVTVTAAGGTSVTSAADNFTYIAGRCTNATLTSNKVSPQSGGPVTFIAAAAGPGCTNPQFQFWTWQPSTGWVMQQAYSSANTWMFDTTGTPPGTTISVDVWVEQAGSSLGPNNYETFGLEAWSIGGCDSATLTPNPATATGMVMFTATAHGSACGTPLFQFWMWSPTTSWVLEQPYSATNTWSLDTTTLAPATYSIDVWVKQQGSPVTYETWALSTLPKGECGLSAVTPDQASPQPVGLTVKFTAAAPGCTTPQFRYWIYPGAGGTWQMLRDYSSDPTYSWSTSGLKPGTYSIVVHVLQAGSTAAYDTDALYAYSVTGSSSATLVAAPVSPQPNGTSVVFTGHAPGSAVQYQFWTYPPGGPWVSHTFSSTATFNWNTTGLSPGTYAWVVYVVQTGSANAYDSWALLSFTVT
ncbi:MAG TPA: IPT/TIG domain-containing protein [Candidatus Dormibacteraeota bacterium]|nr:IPT/TIG domain-containing protein [Candidatus Dormibacteraeota bacterium]